MCNSPQHVYILRVVGRAARRSCLPGLLRGSGGRQAGTRVLSCLVWWCELSRLNRPTSAFCAGVRPAVALTVPSPPDILRR